MVFALHFMGYQESKGNVLKNRIIHFTGQTEIPNSSSLGKDLWKPVTNHTANSHF